MRILITGANGFLGSYLVSKLLVLNHEVIATGKGECRLPFITEPSFVYTEMDFTNSKEVDQVFKEFKPAVIIHSGAISKPDECEKDKENAYQVNVIGTVNLLQSSLINNCFFSFISTDFIFDGITGNYCEEDHPDPVNYYGKTKLIAESKVKEYSGDWNIIRTVLVYGKPNSGRQNLLTIIKEKLENGEEYSVFNDQLRTPTFVGDLANGIITTIEKKATGVFHISGRDVLTPYEMAYKTADFLGLNKNLINKITEQDMKQIARRPLRTGFNITKAIILLNYNPISFDEGLIKTFLNQD